MIPGKQYRPADLLAIARQRFWLVLAPFAIVSLATFVGARALSNQYRSDTLILVVPQRVPESYVRSTVTTRIEDRLQSISQQILSRTRLERVIQDFNLYVKERRTGIMEDVVERMRKDIDVQIVKGDAFRVSYTGDEPRTVMKVTERLASLFIEENLRDREVLAEGSYQFLEAQLEEARRKLVEHEKKLEEYRRRYSGQLPSQLESNLQVIQNAQIQIQALNESMARDRDRRLIIERLIADATTPDPASVPVLTVAVPGVEGPAVGTVAQQFEAARRALQQMELRLKPEHPDIVAMKRTIKSLEEKAATEALQAPVSPEASTPPRRGNPAEVAKQNRLKEMNAELANLDRQIAHKESDEKELRKVAAAYQTRVEAVPTRESELTELTRDYDTLQKAYTSLLGKKEDSKIAANLERRQIGEQFKILDPARLPEKPYSPDRVRINIIGAVFGLGLGLGLATLLEYGDSTFKTEEDVVLALSLPVLALVPLMTTRREQRTTRRRRVIVAVASSAAVVLATVALLVWKLKS